MAEGRFADRLTTGLGAVLFQRDHGVHTNSNDPLGEYARLRGLGSQPPDQSILAEALHLRDWN